jgi:nicotinamide mononucleotide transporter
MEKIKKALTQEFLRGYSTFDKLFMASMLALQIITFIIVPDTALSIIAGISGVISTVLCAKGKISFYFIGFVQTISYLILSWQNKFYGEVMENIFYLVTMVWGIFVWKKNSEVDDSGSANVKALKFTPLMWTLSIASTAVATFIMGFILTKIGSAQAYTDAATNILAIFAQLLMVKRYREQWIWWLVIDVLCIKMWFVAGNWTMVAMYIAWTINCIYGWVNWSKLENKQNASTEIETNISNNAVANANN